MARRYSDQPNLISAMINENFKEIEARLSANLGVAIYSDELAGELRISVRTMHTAMLKIRA